MRARCDSYVLETNVHFPTDLNLLWDAVRTVVVLTARYATNAEIIPATSSSATSFSSGETLGVSAGASEQEGVPTLSVGVSESSTSGVSQTVADFTVANNSADDEVNHDYNLSSTPNGLYTGPDSLVIKPSATDF